MARLVINPNTPSAWEIQLRPGANLLGRGFANDFKIDHPSVSSSHCQIVVESGRVVIKDLGSTNGTFVNRAPVSEAALLPGQSIHLGGVEIMFQADASPNARVAETEMIPRAAMPPPIAPGLVASAPAAHVARIVTAAPVPASVATVAPPRPAGISLAARAAPPPVAVVSAAAPAVAVHRAPSPVEPPTAGISSGGNCKFHPKTAGRYLCNPCHHYFCELCVTSRTSGNAQGKFCRHCGAELVPVQVKVTYTAPKSFFQQVPGAFVYPFKGAGILILIVSTIMFKCLAFFTPQTRWGYVPRTASWTLMFCVMAIGYLFSFMQSIIHAAAIGEEEMPSLPSMANFWEDVLLPALQFVGLILICFSPAIAVSWYMIGNEDTSWIAALIAAVVLGILYFPMAFLAVAMLDSVMAANPLQVIPSILKVPVEYLVTVVLLGIVLGLPTLGDELLPLIFPRGLATHNMGKLFGYLGASAFWSLFSLYLLVVGIRILGLLFYTKRDKLGWLER